MAACRWRGFFLGKTSLLLLILLMVVMEFTAEHYISPGENDLCFWVGRVQNAAGHGLHISETDCSSVDPAQWMRLDESWRSLFGEKLRIASTWVGRLARRRQA